MRKQGDLKTTKSVMKVNGPKYQNIIAATVLLEKIIDAIKKQKITLIENSSPPPLDSKQSSSITADLSYEGISQSLEKAVEMAEINLKRFQIYHDAIDEILSSAGNVLDLLLESQPGGRKPNVHMQEIAIRLAKKYFKENSRHYTAQQLSDAVCRELLNENPKMYAEMVRKKYIGEVDKGLDENNLTWRQVQSLPRPYPTRTASDLLKTLRDINT